MKIMNPQIQEAQCALSRKKLRELCQDTANQNC